MDLAIHEQLIQDTNRLRSLLAGTRTSSVVGFCLTYHLRRANDPEFDGGLSSPARQIAFLLGLLLSTPEPANPRKFQESDWTRSLDLLNQIFGAYQAAMWPDPKDIPQLSDEWRRVREVAGQALIYYHNTGLMATVEQLRTRTRDYVVPFDAFLEDEWGLGAQDALHICDFILQRWEDHRDALAAAIDDENRARHALVREWEADGLSIEEVRGRADESGYGTTFDNLLGLLDQTGVIAEEELADRFGSKAGAFWRLFSIERGSVQITYLTEDNPVDTRPLILLDERTAMCPSINAIFQAVLLSGERTLERSSERGRYRRARDKKLEDQVENVARQLLGDRGEYHRAVFETPDAHFEHDLVVIRGASVLVFEAKASPPKEPFRDLDRGFVRLRHAFGGDGGIQKAYEQAEHIRARLASGETVELYDEHGELQARLDPGSHQEIHMICVSRDDWGPLAVDLSLLLERPSREHPYPWAVDILNLQAIASAWTYLHLDAIAFLNFLRERRRLHGRTICWDELDLVGFWLKHGGFHWLNDASADRIHIYPHYSDIFDEIYAATNLGGPPVTLEVTEPFMGNAREIMADIFTQLKNAGRNDPCPCGSGKKFKKCHGRPAI
jgi:hypothetical protein